MLSNFLIDICGFAGTFKMEDRKKKCIELIKKKVGKSKVLMLLSGGVDSTVCAALMKEALSSDQVIAIHIDNGFMRKGESDQVKESLEAIGLKVKGKCKIKSSFHSFWPVHPSNVTLVASELSYVRICFPQHFLP
jgi:GMP synthase (glutamine-hydrolysing)